MAQQANPFAARVHSPFFRQAIGTYATQAMMAVLSLASSVIIARALGPAGRGEYAVAVAIGLIGVQLGNLGLHTSNSYLVARDKTLLSRLVANSLITSLGLGGAGAALIGLTLMVWARSPLSGWLLWLSLLWIPFGLAYLLSVNLLMGLLEVRLYNTVELMNKALATLCIVVAVGFGTRRPETLFLTVLIVLIFSFCVALQKLSRFYSSPARPAMKLFQKNFQLGWKAYLASFLAFLVIRIDLLMVKSISGATAAGYYSVAGTFADAVLLLPVAVGAVLFPKLSGMLDDGQKWALTRKAIAATGAGLLAVLLMLGLSANFLVPLLFGRAFAPAAVAFLLLCPGILFLGLETVLVQHVNSCGFPFSVVVLWVLASLLNVLSNLWAIPRYGINGAALVSSVSYLFALLGVAAITYMRRNTSSTRQLAAAIGAIRE